MTLASNIRWVAVRVVRSRGAVKASEVLGEVEAPDKVTAVERARTRWGFADISVISKLSYDMSTDEADRLSRRLAARAGKLVGRGARGRRH